MSAALPSLGRLSLQPARVLATGTYLKELPPELLALIIGAIDSEDPCATVYSLCDAHPLWRGWCLDEGGKLFDWANRALGYYGEFAGWAQVVQHYQDNLELPPTSYKQYFRWACDAHFDPETLEGVVERIDPFTGARLLRHVASDDYVQGSFDDDVPTDLWNYGEIAKVVVQKDVDALFYVPDDRADYSEIAKLAMQKNDGAALQLVKPDRADYDAIAKVAVRTNSDAMQWVPKDHADYGELAKLAVQLYPDAFEGVPDDRDDYVEIAKLAMDRWPDSLQYVRDDRDDYLEIALAAVRSDGQALRFVDLNHDDYREIAMEAVFTNQDVFIFMVNPNHPDYGDIAKSLMQKSSSGYPLKFVPKDHPDYFEIAKVAVQTNPSALQWVAKDHADYGAIAELAAQRAWAKAGKDLTNTRIQELPDFGAIAKIAVKEDGMALKDVPTYRDDYGAIARLALKENGDALEYVPEDRDDYDELAEIAGEYRVGKMGPEGETEDEDSD